MKMSPLSDKHGVVFLKEQKTMGSRGQLLVLPFFGGQDQK